MTAPASWRPYIAGALVGVLAIVSVVVTTEILDKPKYLGASTTYVRTTGLIEKPSHPSTSTATRTTRGRRSRSTGR